MSRKEITTKEDLTAVGALIYWQENKQEFTGLYNCKGAKNLSFRL
jgi:hypothetical protein